MHPHKQPHEPSPAQIAERAFALYEQDGYPVGRDQDHWYQAEAQLIAELNPDQADSDEEQPSKPDRSRAKRPNGENHIHRSHKMHTAAKSA